MAVGGLPLAMFSFLVFIPPVNGVSALNAVWLAIGLTLFYVSFTAYAATKDALISEIGHTPNERLDLATFNSVAWALGFAVGNTVYTLQGVFENTGMTSVESFQTTMVIFGMTSLITLYLPVIFINEKKYCRQVRSEEGSLTAMKTAFKNRNYRFFLFSELAYWFALTFIQTGISYYVVTLLGVDKSYATLAMTVLFLCSFLFYAPINIFAKRLGKRLTEMIGFLVFAMVYLFVLFLGNMPIPPLVQLFCIAVMASLPMAIFGIIPQAIIADVAEADGITTGNYKAGIFYAMRGLFMKFGSSFAGLIFPSIIILGTEMVNPAGIRLTGAFALVFCIVGFFFISRYNEKEVLEILSKDDVK